MSAFFHRILAQSVTIERFTVSPFAVSCRKAIITLRFLTCGESEQVGDKLGLPVDVAHDLTALGTGGQLGGQFSVRVAV
jgi:hypothetical protein